MKQLKKFVADANKAFPENAAKVVSLVREEVARVLENSPKTGRTMECDLMDEGIKHLLDQERSKTKIGIKHAHVPATSGPSVMKFTRTIPDANPPSNAIGRQTIKQKILARIDDGKFVLTAGDDPQKLAALGVACLHRVGEAVLQYATGTAEQRRVEEERNSFGLQFGAMEQFDDRRCFDPVYRDESSTVYRVLQCADRLQTDPPD